VCPMGAGSSRHFVSARTRSGAARLSVGLSALALVLAVAGCGDDDEEPAATATTPSTQAETDSEAETAPAEPPATVSVPEEEAAPPPEEQPGGVGDEEPARSQASFTGRGGRITPRAVRVAPFIAVRIELRSADGGTYGLSCRGRSLRVDADIATTSTRIAGRRPGDRVRCAALGPHNPVVISASAEPGP